MTIPSPVWSVFERGSTISMPSCVQRRWSTSMPTNSLRRKPPKNPTCSSALSRAAFNVARLASRATINSRSSIGSALAFRLGRPWVSAMPARVWRTVGVDVGSAKSWRVCHCDSAVRRSARVRGLSDSAKAIRYRLIAGSSAGSMLRHAR
ncbi:hypothetical protein LPN04_29515 [Rugamonas sp. A1-17]|nr:hypothetical protein [Rugamonas sp. A1-17]